VAHGSGDTGNAICISGIRSQPVAECVDVERICATDVGLLFHSLPATLTPSRAVLGIATSCYENSPLKSPPASLLALDGRRLDSLSTAEKAVFQRYRNGRFRNGFPWISVGLTTSHLDTFELLRAPTQAQADALLKRAGAVIQVRVYD
jgi:hypothetical protein